VELGEGVDLGGSSKQIAKQIAVQLDQVPPDTLRPEQERRGFRGDRL